jgi:holo-[acyl-carrier protein] synthase
VVNQKSGKPTLHLTGGAKSRLDELTPPGHAADILLTMTDDFPFAQAFVIITASPASSIHT